MNPLWTLLFVLSAPRGVLSQVQLRESGPSLVKPSQTLSLTCTVSGLLWMSSDVDWVRQAPPKALEILGGNSSSGTTDLKPALKTRLTITKNNSKSQVSLSLNNMTTDDTATYYCSNGLVVLFMVVLVCNIIVVFRVLRRHAWGQGLLVTVSSQGESHPRVF
nr:immunoglobulin mu heavy chain [Bos taurus]